MAILVFVKRKDIIAIRYALFSASVVGWAAPTALWISQNYSEGVTLFLSRLSHTFAVFIPITWLHFVFAFLRKKEPVKGFYFASYLFAAFLSLISHTDLFIPGLHAVINFKYFTSPGPLYILYVLFFFAYVSYGFMC